MIRLTSRQQALSLLGTIPELAIIRSIQFMGDGYDPEEHGHIIVIQEGSDITKIKEIGEDGEAVFDYEFIERFFDSGRIVFEAVYQLDDLRTVAVIIPDETWLDANLRSTLKKASTTPQPLPTIKP